MHHGEIFAVMLVTFDRWQIRPILMRRRFQPQGCLFAGFFPFPQVLYATLYGTNLYYIGTCKNIGRWVSNGILMSF